MKALFAMLSAKKYLITTLLLLLLLLQQMSLFCTKSVKECPSHSTLLSTVGLERSLWGDLVTKLNVIDTYS